MLNLVNLYAVISNQRNSVTKNNYNNISFGAVDRDSYSSSKSKGNAIDIASISPSMLLGLFNSMAKTASDKDLINILKSPNFPADLSTFKNISKRENNSELIKALSLNPYINFNEIVTVELPNYPRNYQGAFYDRDHKVQGSFITLNFLRGDGDEEILKTILENNPYISVNTPIKHVYEHEGFIERSEERRDYVTNSWSGQRIYTGGTYTHKWHEGKKEIKTNIVVSAPNLTNLSEDINNKYKLKPISPQKRELLVNYLIGGGWEKADKLYAQHNISQQKKLGKSRQEILDWAKAIGNTSVIRHLAPKTPGINDFRAQTLLSLCTQGGLSPQEHEKLKNKMSKFFAKSPKGTISEKLLNQYNNM